MSGRWTVASQLGDECKRDGALQGESEEEGRES